MKMPKGAPQKALRAESMHDKQELWVRSPHWKEGPLPIPEYFVTMTPNPNPCSTPPKQKVKVAGPVKGAMVRGDN